MRKKQRKDEKKKRKEKCFLISALSGSSRQTSEFSALNQLAEAAEREDMSLQLL
jgi:hypothetical protein